MLVATRSPNSFPPLSKHHPPVGGTLPPRKPFTGRSTMNRSEGTGAEGLTLSKSSEVQRAGEVERGALTSARGGYSQAAASPAASRAHVAKGGPARPEPSAFPHALGSQNKGATGSSEASSHSPRSLAAGYSHPRNLLQSPKSHSPGVLPRLGAFQGRPSGELPSGEGSALRGRGMGRGK